MGILEIVSSMEWEQESYPQYGDFIVLPIFAFFFPIVRFLLDRFVFEPVDSEFEGYGVLEWDAIVLNLVINEI
ncbi:TRAM protein [Perilla frutescens var. hirtella]|nr:TRAM protein [Perilla frutescens var. frutescens]KAH6801268.1 TRAM protein [Perilla frutescens var. hirtella]